MTVVALLTQTSPGRAASQRVCTPHHTYQQPWWLVVRCRRGAGQAQIARNPSKHLIIQQATPSSLKATVANRPHAAVPAHVNRSTSHTNYNLQSIDRTHTTHTTHILNNKMEPPAPSPPPPSASALAAALTRTLPAFFQHLAYLEVQPAVEALLAPEGESTRQQLDVMDNILSPFLLLAAAEKMCVCGGNVS